MEHAIFYYLLPISVAFLLAWILHRLSDGLVRRFVRVTDLAPAGLRISPERRRTLRDLLSSAVSALGFLLATLFALGRFVDAETLIWLVGLFAAGFGFAARPLISDFLTGLGFIFDDEFDVGDKVEILGVEGVVERIRLRTTTLRATSGELFFVPNGEIRVVRNFSRGRFSPANIRLRIRAVDLRVALPVLEDLGREALTLYGDLLEPWQVISADGAVSETVELTLIVRARFKTAADLRPQLLALVSERLAQANIQTLAGE